MVTLKPFAAYTPRPELAAQICELPYDVMSSEEARQIAAGNPLSFLHVSKPEIDLPPGTDAVRAGGLCQGRGEFRGACIAQGALRAGRAAAASISTARSWAGTARSVWSPRPVARNTSTAIISKHELTRPDKEDDRVRHIEALECADRPGVPDLSRRARRWTSSSPGRPPSRRTWISPPAMACATRPG